MHRTCYIFSVAADALNAFRLYAGPCSAVGNVSDNRCESDCRSRGREFNLGPVPYLCGD